MNRASGRGEIICFRNDARSIRSKTFDLNTLGCRILPGLGALVIFRLLVFDQEPVAQSDGRNIQERRPKYTIKPHIALSDVQNDKSKQHVAPSDFAPSDFAPSTSL